MIIYLLEFSSLLILAAIGYFIFLKNIRDYALSRIYIIGSIAISVVLPFMPVLSSDMLHVFTIVLPEVTINAYRNVSAELTPDASYSKVILIGILYAFISLIFLLRLVVATWSLSRLLKNSTKKTIAGELCNVSDKVKNPFSFFNYIVLPSDATYLSEEIEAIVKHEKLHVRYGHSIEKLILELFKCICWWHPVAWYYTSELDLVHEYQVDEAMSTQMDFSEYKKLLISLVLYPPGLRLVNPISSNIKKRLKMMNQKKQSNSTLRFIGLSALLIIGSISIHSCQKEDVSDLSSPTENTVVEALTNDKKDTYQYESIDTFTTFDYDTYEETVEIIKKESTVYTAPQTMPMFPGCDALSGEELKECSTQKLLQFIYKNIKYPNEARKAGKEGTVVVQFIIDTSGKLYGTKFIRTIGPEFEDTISDMLMKMNNEVTWIPGKDKGKAVDVQYTLPVKFKLEG